MKHPLPRLAAGALAAGGLALGGCVTGVAYRLPAVLQSSDAQSLTALKTALSGALGVPCVELGAGDPAAQPVVTVQPSGSGSCDGGGLARPVVFDLELRGGACVAVRREAGQPVALDGVACRAFGG